MLHIFLGILHSNQYKSRCSQSFRKHPLAEWINKCNHEDLDVVGTFAQYVTMYPRRYILRSKEVISQNKQNLVLIHVLLNHEICCLNNGL